MSVYNDIYISNKPVGVIAVDFNPDQFTRDFVLLDKEDFLKILHLARELGWATPETAA